MSMSSKHTWIQRWKALMAVIVFMASPLCALNIDIPAEESTPADGIEISANQSLLRPQENPKDTKKNPAQQESPVHTNRQRSVEDKNRERRPVAEEIFVFTGLGNRARKPITLLESICFAPPKNPQSGYTYIDPKILDNNAAVSELLNQQKIHIISGPEGINKKILDYFSYFNIFNNFPALREKLNRFYKILKAHRSAQEDPPASYAYVVCNGILRFMNSIIPQNCPFDKIVFECTYSNFKTAAYDLVLRYFPKGEAIAEKLFGRIFKSGEILEPIKCVANIPDRVPIFILASKKDSIISYYHGIRLYQAFQEKRQEYYEQGGSNNVFLHIDENVEHCEFFLNAPQGSLQDPAKSLLWFLGTNDLTAVPAYVQQRTEAEINALLDQHDTQKTQWKKLRRVAYGVATIASLYAGTRFWKTTHPRPAR